MNRMLLIEDDKKISEITHMYLTHQGYEVTCVYNAREAKRELEQTSFCFVIFDALLPDGDGYQLLRKLREGDFFVSEHSTATHTPALMLTALGQTEHVVKGFEAGADDYVSKPFEPAELVARITAILKRSTPQTRTASYLQIAELQIELSARIVKSRGKELALNRREYDLLLFFCRNVGKVFNREQLISHIWGFDFDGSDRSVDVCVQRVRSKLTQHKTRLHIKTVWGVGYMLEELES